MNMSALRFVKGIGNHEFDVYGAHLKSGEGAVDEVHAYTFFVDECMCVCARVYIYMMCVHVWTCNHIKYIQIVFPIHRSPPHRSYCALNLFAIRQSA